MSTTLRPATIAATTLGTLAAGIVIYALYFDHRRRTDPDFRRALKRSARRAQRADKEESHAESTQRARQIKEIVKTVQKEEKPSSREEREAFFLELLSEGERLLRDGECLTGLGGVFF